MRKALESKDFKIRCREINQSGDRVEPEALGFVKGSDTLHGSDRDASVCIWENLDFFFEKHFSDSPLGTLLRVKVWRVKEGPFSQNR